MQLAASQRPHPPPVPPRPSRQVVAEALKRSPRPPCPTRQAPPPPNIRPWRSEDHENSLIPKGGRTVVYESTKELTTVEQVRSSSEPPRLFCEPRLTNKVQRSLASPWCSNDDEIASIVARNSNITENTAAAVEKTEVRSGGSTRAKSERNSAENQRERYRNQQPHRRSNGNEPCHQENSIPRLNEADNEIRSTDRRSVISYEHPLLTLGHEEPSISVISTTVVKPKRDLKKDENNYEIRDGERGKFEHDSLSGIGDQTVTKALRNCDESTKKLDEKYTKLVDGSVDEIIAKSAEIEEPDIHNECQTLTKCPLSFGKPSNCEEETESGTRQSLTTPTTNEKNSSSANVNNMGGCKIEQDKRVEPISREDKAGMFGSATTISSDDCATVVVIDEPERKIAFNEDNDNIHHQDWLEAGVRYSSTKITLPGDDSIDRTDGIANFYDNHQYYDDDERRAYAQLDFSSIRERIAMSSLQGLPPLPRSLSGFNLSEGRREACEPPPPPTRSSSKTPKNIKPTQPSSSRPSPPGRQLTTLDTQLAILRKEMFGLRQLDLSLLSQLWSLNESIQEFRQLLQDQEDRAPSPSPSSEEGDDNSYGSHPPPPPRRPAPLLHHHRPPRPPRPLRPPASDESPSSEEYGAV